METLDVINKRKSVRGYEDKQVEEEKLEIILKAGNSAPNAGPFHITVIQDANFIKQINDKSKAIMLVSEGFMKERASLPGYEPLYGAPTLIIISAPEGPFTQINVACSATTMILAATDLGLGSCYAISPLLPFNNNVDLLEKLNLPEGFTPVSSVLLGYANGEGFPTQKEEVDNINRI